MIIEGHMKEGAQEDCSQFVTGLKLFSSMEERMMFMEEFTELKVLLLREL